MGQTRYGQRALSGPEPPANDPHSRLFLRSLIIWILCGLKNNVPPPSLPHHPLPCSPLPPSRASRPLRFRTRCARPFSPAPLSKPSHPSSPWPNLTLSHRPPGPEWPFPHLIRRAATCRCGLQRQVHHCRLPTALVWTVRDVPAGTACWATHQDGRGPRLCSQLWQGRGRDAKLLSSSCPVRDTRLCDQPQEPPLP